MIRWSSYMDKTNEYDFLYTKKMTFKKITVRLCAFPPVFSSLPGNKFRHNLQLILIYYGFFKAGHCFWEISPNKKKFNQYSTYTFKIKIFLTSCKHLAKSRKLWKIKKILSFQEFLSTFSDFPRISLKIKKFSR